MADKLFIHKKGWPPRPPQPVGPDRALEDTAPELLLTPVFSKLKLQHVPWR